MRLKALLADMNSAARCVLAWTSLVEAKANLFAFPGGDEQFAIRRLLWMIACTSLVLVLAATLAATSSTTFWLVELFFLGGTMLWLPRNIHLGVRSRGMRTLGGNEPEGRPANVCVPIVVVVRSCHENIAPRWSVAEEL